MDEVVFFEGTVASSGRKRRKIIVYVPTKYYRKLEKYVGRRVRVLAVVEGDGSG